jgi:pimeloyl-ACP methyl ester carboxylesterase
MAIRLANESPKVSHAFAIAPPLVTQKEVAEYQYNIRLNRWFDWIDENKDGEISLEEFKEQIAATPRGWEAKHEIWRVTREWGLLVWYSASRFTDKKTIVRQDFIDGFKEYLWQNGEQKYAIEESTRKAWGLSKVRISQEAIASNVKNAHTNLGSPSGMELVSKSSKPVFIYTAGKDEYVPPSGTAQLVEELGEHPKDNVQITTFPNAPHEIAHSEDWPSLLRKEHHGQITRHPNQTKILDDIKQSLKK